MSHHCTGHRAGRRGGDLCVDVSADATAAEARLRGALDAATAGQLDVVVEQLIRSGCRNLVLDLSELDFLAAAGLHALVRAHTALEAAGGSLTLVKLPRMARRVLDVTGLDTTFVIG